MNSQDCELVHYIIVQIVKMFSVILICIWATLCTWLLAETHGHEHVTT